MLFNLQKQKCAYCNKKFKKAKNMEREHLLLNKDGGTYHVSNICLTCHHCNHDLRKESYTYPPFLKVQKQRKRDLNNENSDYYKTFETFLKNI